MTNWVENVEVGDKVRYLGGDPNYWGNLTVGKDYEVIGLNLITIYDDVGDIWEISEGAGNLQCFEPIKDSQSATKTTEDLLVNLAQEVAKLKRELIELRGDVQSQAYEDNERIERILDDIDMLDERTQGVNNDGQKLLSKEVYIYDTE